MSQNNASRSLGFREAYNMTPFGPGGAQPPPPPPPAPAPAAAAANVPDKDEKEEESELVNNLVRLSKEYCGDKYKGEIMTQMTKNGKKDARFTKWESHVLPQLSDEEKADWGKLTVDEKWETFFEVAKKVRRQMDFYFNNGKRLDKDLGELTEQTLVKRRRQGQ